MLGSVLGIVRFFRAFLMERGGEGCWGKEVVGCCHPVVCCLKVLSGVNLLEELESSVGCHLFSTLSTLPLSTSLSLSVNRVISAALVLVLHYISPPQLKWFYESLQLLQVSSWIKTKVFLVCFGFFSAFWLRGHCVKYYRWKIKKSQWMFVLKVLICLTATTVFCTVYVAFLILFLPFTNTNA